jgi:hypothetical protein
MSEEGIPSRLWVAITAKQQNRGLLLYWGQILGQIPTKVPKLSQDFSQPSTLEKLSAILQLPKLALV